MTYPHLPEPPRPISRITMQEPLPKVGRLSDGDSTTRVCTEHPVYAMRHIDANGCQTTQILSLTEYLWHVIQQHCRHSCHTLHTQLRGDWTSHNKPLERPHHPLTRHE